MSVFNTLVERGYVHQSTNDEVLLKKLQNEKVVFYAGFDPTADSLHVGSLLVLMVMKRLQEAGHFPIAIIGGGTCMIGDPSGKTSMRQLMTREAIVANGEKIKDQIGNFLNLDGVSGLFRDNADWLLELNHIDFLRDIGAHFKVNEMIRLETNKQRLEREQGLSFIEFSYLLLQSYDFLKLFEQNNCILQLGGSDQWGNILAGANLIKKVKNTDSFGLTFPLLETASGKKMGKTESGTVWLDPNKTSPFEFYQFWRNTEDADVKRFLQLFTFNSKERIDAMMSFKYADISAVKQVLAYDVTCLVHGQVTADEAVKTSSALFSKAGDLNEAPKVPVKPFIIGKSIVDLLGMTLLNGESISNIRKLIKNGGVKINGAKVESHDRQIKAEDFTNNLMLVSVGKKKKVVIELVAGGAP